MTKELHFLPIEESPATSCKLTASLDSPTETVKQIDSPSDQKKILKELIDNQSKPQEIEEDFDQDSHLQWDQIDNQLKSHMKRVIEALLFASAEPISLQKIRDVIDSFHPLKPRQIKKILDELQEDYISQQHAFRLEEIAQGYALRTHEEYAPYIELLYRNKRGEKLSHASTEVLAIIAYRQPMTRPQIDAIRGVDSSGTIAQLLERDLIEPRGKLEAPGRPTLYGTTNAFLKHFGLKDIEQLKVQLTISDTNHSLKKA